MRALVVTGAALTLLWGCAEPTGEPSADDHPSPRKSGSSGGTGGHGGSAGRGGNKATLGGSGGNAGKAGVVSEPDTGAGGVSDGGAESGPDQPNQAGQPAVVDPGPTAEQGELSVHYRAGNASLNDNQIGAHLRIVSSALAPLELSSLSLRYYFTSEPAPPLVIELYTAAAEGTSGYRALPSGSVLAEAKDGFAEVTFSAAAGLLDAGGQVTIELAIHDTGWSGLFDESDDYSFNAAHSSFATWDHVTLYDSQARLSGIEPP